MRRDAEDRLRDELLRAADAGATARRGRRRRWSLGPLVALLAVAAGGVAVAGVVGGTAPDDPDDVPPRAPTVTAKAVPWTKADRERMRREREARAPKTDAKRFFAALRDPSPRDVIRRPKHTFVRAYRGPDGLIDLRADERETCWQYRHSARGGATGSCLPTADVGRRGGFVIEQCDDGAAHPQHRRLAGIVPDGVRVVVASRSGEEQARATVHRNGFVLLTDEPIDTVQIGAARHRLPPVTC